MRQTSLFVSQKIRAVIEELGSRGEGLFQTEGITVFVPKTGPGDEVVVEIHELKGRFGFARVLEFIKRGSAFRTPRCQHFMTCGGCDFQHIPYDSQLDWKMRVTKHWIHRSPLKPFITDATFDHISSPNEFGYRNRVRLQVIDAKPAFHQARSNQPVFLKECPVLVEGFFKEIQNLSQSLVREENLNLLFLNKKLEDFGTFSLGQKKVWISKNSFSQANLAVNEKMWGRILEDVTSLNQHQFAVDLFCGSGNFTLGLEDFFDRVIGIERSSEAIDLAKMSSQKIQWINDDSFRALTNILATSDPSPNFVLLDPSREGALKVCQLLGESQIDKITYVSCQLDTLIRDLVCLVKKHRYRIRRWTTVDLMPQTKHIESIVSLSLS